MCKCWLKLWCRVVLPGKGKWARLSVTWSWPSPDKGDKVTESVTDNDVVHVCYLILGHMFETHTYRLVI